MKSKWFRFLSAAVLALLLCALAPIAPAAEEGNSSASQPWDGVSTASGFHSGDGSFGNPFIISTPAEFNYFATYVTRNGVTANRYFLLSNDLDFGGHAISPVGNKSSKFSGVFDGRGHTISNFTMSSSTPDAFVGLFANINGSQAAVKNFTVSDASISGTVNLYMGVVAGYLTNGTISGVTVADSVSVSLTGADAQGSIGGVAGRVYGTVDFVVSAASVTVGGSANTIFAGGITGVTGNGSGMVRNSVYQGNLIVSGSKVIAGGISGIVGAGNGDGNVESCINTGKLSAAYTCGGIVGNINTVGNSIKGCTNLSTTLEGAAGRTGGVVGTLSKATTLSENTSVVTEQLPLCGSEMADSITEDMLAQMTEITAEDGAAVLAALEAAIADHAKAEAEIVYEEEDENPADTGSETTTEQPETTATPTDTAAPSTSSQGTDPGSETADPEPEEGCSSAIGFGLWALPATISAVAVLARKRNDDK